MALLLFLLSLQAARSVEWWEESKAPILNSASLPRTAGGDKYLLVEFFTPWCHYCHLMFPEFEQFYHMFQDPESPDYREDLIVARVNAGVDQLLALQHNVYAFPTIVIWEPRNAEYKHRVEGYQRRYDLTRLLLHALPEKPSVIAEAVAPEPQPIPIVPGPRPQSEPPVFDSPLIDSFPEEEESTDSEEEETEVEYEIVYRDSAAAIKDELNVTYHRLISALEAAKTDSASLLVSLTEAVKELKSVQRDDRMRDAERFEKLEARLEELHLDIKQRNRLESAQTRLNFTHMVLFLAIGGVVGAALAVLGGKLGDGNRSHGKV